MSSQQPKDRASLCLFTFADGRKCRIPRTTGHPHFCFYHARKESQARVAEKLGNDLNFFLSGEYLSANDLSAALGRIIPAVVRGDIKPRTATTVAYLAQTLLQTIHLAQDEYINAFSTDDWRDTIHHNVNQNWKYRHPAPPSTPAPAPPSNSSTDTPASPDPHPEGDVGAGPQPDPSPANAPAAVPPFTTSKPQADPPPSGHEESDSPSDPEDDLPAPSQTTPTRLTMKKTTKKKQPQKKNPSSSRAPATNPTKHSPLRCHH